MTTNESKFTVTNKGVQLAVVILALLVAVLALPGVAWAATSPLAVTKTVPTSGATEIAPTADIMAYFNHDMKASTITSTTVKIREQGTTTWLGATRSVNNTISPTSTNGGSQSVVTLNPNVDLTSNTTYEVLIVGGRSGVKDVKGKPLGSNVSWTFTTADVTPPDTSIDSGPEGIVASDSATFNFSSNEAGSTFQCSLDDIAFSLCTSPMSYTSLNQGGHTFQVRAIDTAGNTDLTAAGRNWTVDTLAPTVDRVFPADVATGVTLNTNPTATFSEAMKSSSISGQSFTLSSQAGSPVSAQVTYDENSRTATLNPDQDLEASTTYVAKITTSVTDAAGNALAQEKTWSFTTTSGGGSDVTVTPTTLDLSITDEVFCSPRSELLTVTNNGPGDVTFAAVNITGTDANYFSSGSQRYLANNGPFTVLDGNYFQDQVTFTAGPSAEERNSDKIYTATLTYKDGNGDTIGNPVNLTAQAHCLNFG